MKSKGSLGRFIYGCQPKNRGTPKWMVKIIENGTAYFLMDDLEGKPPPLFLVQHPHIDPEKIVQGWIWID